MNELNKAIMRIPWETNPSLGVRWATIIFFAVVATYFLLVVDDSTRNAPRAKPEPYWDHHSQQLDREGWRKEDKEITTP